MTNTTDAKASSVDKKTPFVSEKSHKSKHDPLQNSRAHHGFFSKLNFILALIAIGCAVYCMIVIMQSNHSIAKSESDLLVQIKVLKQQQTDAQNRADSLIKTVRESQENLRNQLALLNKSLQSALQQRLYQTNDWVLQKARYYLELAQINSKWGENIQVAVTLLQAADTLLADVHDPRVLEIRQALAKEIAEIQAMPKFDMAGILSQLDALQPLIADLPMKLVGSQDIQTGTATTGDKKPQSIWRERFKDSLQLLEKLVVIRRHNEDTIPLPSSGYELMLREGIRLKLQEAQWALLQMDEAIYQSFLQQSIRVISQYFEQNNSKTQFLIQQLHALQQKKMTFAKPDLNESISLLNQWIASKESPLPETTGEHAS